MNNLKPYTWKIILESIAVVTSWVILGLLNAIATDVFYFNESIPHKLRIGLGIVIAVLILAAAFVGCVIIASTWPRWRFYKKVYEGAAS